MTTYTTDLACSLEPIGACMVNQLISKISLKEVVLHLTLHQSGHRSSYQKKKIISFRIRFLTRSEMRILPMCGTATELKN